MKRDEVSRLHRYPEVGNNPLHIAPGVAVRASMEINMSEGDLQAVSGTEIDLSGWVFGLDDLFDCPDKVAGKAFAKALQETLTRCPPRVELPWTFKTDDGFGNDPVTDPAILYFTFPLGLEDYPPVWRTSLEDAIDWFLKENDDVERMSALSQRLRELATKIDNAASQILQPRDEALHPNQGVE